MLRSQIHCPIVERELCTFLCDAWEEGWLNEYSDELFLIKAIEKRLDSFVGIDQLIGNNLDMQGLFDQGKNINMSLFAPNFCINLSQRLQLLAAVFGADSIKRFVMDQMSAGKENYSEDTFFEALSEVSVLSYFARRGRWNHAIYEPQAIPGINKKNPEAKFVGNVICMTTNQEEESDQEIVVNVEVKSPAFPHDSHKEEKIAIPTALLSEQGRARVSNLCQENNVTYMPPRVWKLRDFINSAAEKFNEPEKNEFNLLFINWSYRDFPTNSFLEAWALLTNEINGIMKYPDYGLKNGISPEAYRKITAIIVYTESLEGLMFSDFRFVFQRNGAGPRFRMWVLDQNLRQAEWANKSNVLFRATGMNPDRPASTLALVDFKSNSSDEERAAEAFGTKLVRTIIEYSDR